MQHQNWNEGYQANQTQHQKSASPLGCAILSVHALKRPYQGHRHESSTAKLAKLSVACLQWMQMKLFPHSEYHSILLDPWSQIHNPYPKKTPKFIHGQQNQQKPSYLVAIEEEKRDTSKRASMWWTVNSTYRQLIVTLWKKDEINVLW